MGPDRIQVMLFIRILSNFLSLSNFSFIFTIPIRATRTSLFHQRSKFGSLVRGLKNFSINEARNAIFGNRNSELNPSKDSERLRVGGTLLSTIIFIAVFYKYIC